MTEYECEICNDEKATLDGFKDDGMPRYVRCICATKKLWAERLGPQIYLAKRIKTTMLSKHLKDHLWIRGPVATFYSNLRCCLLKQGLAFKFNVLNDSKIFNIWISKDKDYDSLQDLVELDLLVITLGATVYENKAHASVLQEAVHTRMMEGKVTWLQSQLEVDEVLKSHKDAPESIELFKDMLETYFKRVVLGKSLTVAQKIQDANTVAIGTPPRRGRGKQGSKGIAEAALSEIGKSLGNGGKK